MFHVKQLVKPLAKETKRRAWPAEKVQLWPLARIKPYPNNPRTHSEEQVKQIAASMQRFGVTSPVLVDEKGILIYGHGRLRAAQFLELARLPVVVARGWSEDDKRAYRIADNQIALNAEWDVPLLSVELRELSLSGYDMPILGFGDMELVEFMAYRDGEVGEQGEVAAPDRELTDTEKPLMIEVWQRLAGEWLAIIEKQETLSTNFTRGALAALFLRARFFGSAIPGQATLAYTPHRALTAAGRTISVPEALRKALTNEQNIVERLWFVMGGKPRLDGLLGSTLPFLDARIPGEFPVDLARSLIDEFCPPGGRVLDPCHGWGGRMLGFLLSKAGTYHGFDTDPLTVNGVQAMFDDLHSYADGKRAASLVCHPFEDAKLKQDYDFALTSPPYFDTEKYGGPESSWRRYKTFETWVDGFYRPLLTKAARALKPGGMFALQIGNQRYPLEQAARDLAPDCGLAAVATRFTEMSDHGYVGLGTEGAVERDPAEHEVVLLLRAGGDYEAAAVDVARKYGRVL
jgi:hypothetical protein